MSGYDGLNWSPSKVLAVGTCFLIPVVITGLILIALVTRVGQNDAAKIARDRAVKVACINSGAQLISGNCVRIGGGR